jgi:hypothetical protein
MIFSLSRQQAHFQRLIMSVSQLLITDAGFFIFAAYLERSALWGLRWSSSSRLA